MEEQYRQAETKKEEGNVQYKLKNYHDALQLYSDAIEMCPEIPAYYNNRAACEMMLSRYDRALADARQAIKLDSNFAKAYLREAKCHTALGDAQAALRSLETVKVLDPTNTSLESEIKINQQLQLFDEEAAKALMKKDYRKVVFCVDRAITSAVACKRLKILKAESLAFLGRYQEAQEIVNDLLKSDSMNADAIYVRGICLYYQDNIEKALSHFQQVLKFAPDHDKAQQIYKRAKNLKVKKEEGNEAFKMRRFPEAYSLYSDALTIDPSNDLTNAKLYFNRATVASKIDKLNQAVEDCTKAIQLDKEYIKAYLRRAKCYMDLKQYEDAVRDYEKTLQMDNNRDTKQLLQEAKLAMKKSKRKDYYEILGLDHNANDDEIRKAYRKRALVHHPDRHANASEEVKKEEEKKFKEVGEAYGVLSDPKKRSRYDNGYDLEDMEGFQDIDPNNIFQAFFGGPGHFQFTTSPNMANGFANGFPGGFTFQFG